MPQNNIKKTPISSLGHNFVKPQFLPTGMDEYYLREKQEKSGIHYRHLSAYEIEVLIRNRNTSDNWNTIYVSDAFNPELVKNCKFFGLVRIGKLEPYCLEFSDLKLPVGLYNSTIISSDFGDNVVVDNVNYLSNYIIGNEAIIVNVNELITTNHAKFGNGIVKEGEEESIRIWLEICNENAGRKVIPFNGMLPGDAYLWSRNRDDNELLNKFQEFTELKFNRKRGYYGKIGHRTVIKNCSSIKDVWVGNDAYIKGANKLKNLTINSGEEGKTQIGEGCEIVNGIIDYGCRIFYGVKAVRFIMASHSQLKYGARLINSYLGNNATISCCEVLNSLIFPAHEQHHNNSFLCAALIMGQSNIAAGATLGSNHNSRGADGEFMAGRGFWPGLCVSIKHNTKLASFTILLKGDYPAELDVQLPFSLVSMDLANDRLTILPAYWFLYNMYALARNSWKYKDRDKRGEKKQSIEYDFLAPDTINEMFVALALLEEFTGKAYLLQENPTLTFTTEAAIKKGKELFKNNDPIIDSLDIRADHFENTKRPVVVIKARIAYSKYKEMIAYYGTMQLLDRVKQRNFKTLEEVVYHIPNRMVRNEWVNVGGQLIPEEDVKKLKNNIKLGKIKSWDHVHHFYQTEGQMYEEKKFKHALASLQQISGVPLKKASLEDIATLLDQAVDTKNWITEEIFQSRAKDYENPYRKMMYDSDEERDAVIGKLENNSFIVLQREEIKIFNLQVHGIKKKLKMKLN